MSRGDYSAGKRRREADKARKNRDKEDRLRRNRENSSSGGDLPVASVADIQTAAFEASPEDVLADGTVRNEGEASRDIPCRLFVGGLSWDTDDASLRQAFEKFGEVQDAVVALDRDTGRSRGFGFVTMAGRKAASKAIEGLDGHDLDGRSVRVNLAVERGR